MASDKPTNPATFPRIFVEWTQAGAWLNSEGSDFQADLRDMVALYGEPDIVEYRNTYEGRGLCASCLASDSDEAYANCAD